MKTYVSPDGREFAAISDREAAFQWNKMFNEGEYGACTYRPGAVVVDVGANIGMFLAYVVLREPTIRVYSFEPCPPLLTCLEQNAKTLPGSHKIRQVAVGCKPASALEIDFLPQYTMLSGKAAASQLPLYEAVAQRDLSDTFKPESFTVEVVTLADELADEPVIDLVKIDVEGMELDVLHGMGDDLLKRVRQLIIEVHEVNLEETMALLRTAGFDVRRTKLAAPAFVLGEGHIVEGLNTCCVRAVRTE